MAHASAKAPARCAGEKGMRPPTSREIASYVGRPFWAAITPSGGISRAKARPRRGPPNLLAKGQKRPRILLQINGVSDERAAAWLQPAVLRRAHSEARATQAPQMRQRPSAAWRISGNSPDRVWQRAQTNQAITLPPPCPPIVAPAVLSQNRKIRHDGPVYYNEGT